MADSTPAIVDDQVHRTSSLLPAAASSATAVVVSWAHEQFRVDHPRKTIFLAMRFTSSPVMQAITQGVRSAADRHGFDVVRADDRDYTGEIWSNIELCLQNSELVVVILDEVDRRDCDANVMVELGFALGLGRRCLLLVDRSLSALPVVLRHRRVREFDSYDVPGSVDRQVEQWLERDVGGHPFQQKVRHPN